MVCITGGPGAGKSAISDVIKREFHHGVLVLPETATMLYSGGFPRGEDNKELRVIQSAIYHVQSNAEAIAKVHQEEQRAMVLNKKMDQLEAKIKQPKH